MTRSTRKVPNIFFLGYKEKTIKVLAKKRKKKESSLASNTVIQLHQSKPPKEQVPRSRGPSHRKCLLELLYQKLLDCILYYTRYKINRKTRIHNCIWKLEFVTAYNKRVERARYLELLYLGFQLTSFIACDRTSNDWSCDSTCSAKCLFWRDKNIGHVLPNANITQHLNSDTFPWNLYLKQNLCI